MKPMGTLVGSVKVTISQASGSLRILWIKRLFKLWPDLKPEKRADHVVT